MVRSTQLIHLNQHTQLNQLNILNQLFNCWPLNLGLNYIDVAIEKIKVKRDNAGWFIS